MIRINAINKKIVDEFRDIFGEYSPVAAVETYENGSDNCDIKLSKNVLLMYSNDETILFYRGCFARLSACDFLNIEIH